MMVILGSMGNFAGAIVGAFAFQYLLHVFKDISKHWQLLMGGFIVLVVVAAPRGLLGMFAQRARQGVGRITTMAEVLLSARKVTKRLAAWPPSMMSRWTCGGNESMR